MFSWDWAMSGTKGVDDAKESEERGGQRCKIWTGCYRSELADLRTLLEAAGAPEAV